MDQTKKIMLKYSKHLLVVLVLLIPSQLFAASLFFEPSGGKYTVGQNFSVNVVVGSSDQPMNAAQGVITFPGDKLQVTSISKGGSIFSLWVQEPSFSNAIGSINFEGVVLNPGYIGARGKILTINFRAKEAGSASVKITNGQVLANDGRGSDILKTLGSATYTISSGVAAPPEDITPELETALEAPVIVSDTHPKEDQWYSDKNVNVSWEIPGQKGIDAIRLLADLNPVSTPSVVYVPPIQSKELVSLDDGVWYFHAGFRDTQGWGRSAHFKIQIDTTPPSFDIRQIHNDDKTDPQPRFAFETVDETSGISHYEIIIDDHDQIRWEDDGSHVYMTQVLGPGKHTMKVRAVDRAGNATEDTVVFVVDPLLTPEITDWSEEANIGDQLFVKGISKYPDGRIIMYVKDPDGEVSTYAIQLNGKGNFMVESDDITKRGTYKLWIEATDERGARSMPSKELPSDVDGLSLILMGVLFLIALIIIALLIYRWILFVMKVQEKEERLRKEVLDVEKALQRVFDILEQDIEEKIVGIKKPGTKKKLGRVKEKLLKDISKNLNEAEAFVKKEIVDVKKEIDDIPVTEKKKK